MTFKVKKTSDASVADASKTLVYAHAGFGKTTQAKHLAEYYGKTFILSGESGLRSVLSADLDYLPFSSWDGDHDPDQDVYSFRGICRMMATPEFRAAGYKAVMIDSATEVSERCFEHFKEVHKNSKDGFAVWGDYGTAFLGAMKWVRDLPYHVCVTCLAVEDKDENGEANFWPSVVQAKIQKQVCGIFDNVFGGIRRTSTVDGKVKVERFLVTDEVRGWHGKARDEKQRLKPVERTANITELFRRMDMPDSEYERFVASAKAAEPTTTQGVSK